MHEVFHWLSIDGKYVTDYHGDGAKGLPDQKYYGDANALMLAEQKPAWAIYNNDNYARFARRVGVSWRRPRRARDAALGLCRNWAANRAGIA